MKRETELSSLINVWIEGRSSRSISTLARIAGISYSSAWRACHGIGSLSQEVTIAILKSILSPEDASRMVTEFYPNLSFALEETVEAQKSSDDIEVFIESIEHFNILALASAPSGTTLDEITHMFGERYIPFFEILIRSKILEKKDNRWFYQKKAHDLDADQLRRLMASAQADWNAMNAKSPFCASASLGFFVLDSEKAKKVYEIVTEAYEQIQGLSQQSANCSASNVVMRVGLFHDVLKGREQLLL